MKNLRDLSTEQRRKGPNTHQHQHKLHELFQESEQRVRRFLEQFEAGQAGRQRQRDKHNYASQR